MQKNTKRWIRYSSLTLVLIILLGTTGVAISGFKGGRMVPFGAGMMKERMISRMDYTMQELQLTPEQQAKYSKIRAKMIAGLESAETRHQALHDAVKAEMSKEQPDLKVLAKTVKREINAMPDLMSMQIDSMMEIYDALEATQQKKLTEILKERLERRHGRCGPDGPGGPAGQERPMDRS